MPNAGPMPASRRPPLWVWLVAAPLLLLALAWVALLVLLPPARATQLVREQLTRSLAREVRFEQVALSLWPPVRLSVKRIELAEPGGFDRGSAFSAASLDLDLDVLALLSRHVKIRRLAFDGPALHLLLRADGTTNFDGIGASPTGNAQAAPPLDLDVREFSVRGGHVLVDDLANARRITFALGTRMSLSAEQAGTRFATDGTSVLSGLAFGPSSAARLSDLDQSFAKLEWRVQHRGKYDAKSNRLALETLAIEFGRTQLALSGLVDSVGPRARFDLKAHGAALDVEQLLSWVAVADAKAVKGLSGHGQVSFDLRLLGSAAPNTRPVVTGVLMLKDAAFRYPGAPADVGGLSLTANFRPDTLFIPDLKAVVAGQPVSARLLAWHFTDPMLDFALRGNVDLAAVAPMLAPAGTQLGGHAVVDMSGHGRAQDPGTLVLGGHAQLQNVSVEGAGLPKKIDNVNGRIDFLPESAAIQRLTARAGQSSFSIDATVQRPLALMADPAKVAPAEVEFSFRSTYLDLAELLPTTPGAPFLPNASGGGRVAIDRLKQGKLDVTGVQAEVKLAPATLESPHFSLQGYGGTVTGDARFDLRDTRQPSYAIHAAVEQVKADAILGAWTPIKDLLAGTLSSKIDFSGTGQTPDAILHTLTLVGLAALTDGKLGPGPALAAVAQFVKVPKFKQIDFSHLELPMRIEHGRVVTDPVVLNGASGEWRFTGALGFDGALDYAVSVTLPPNVADALGARSALAAGAMSDAQGRILLDLHVTGSAKSPRICVGHARDAGAARGARFRRAGGAAREARSGRARGGAAGAAQPLRRRGRFLGDEAAADGLSCAGLDQGCGAGVAEGLLRKTWRSGARARCSGCWTPRSTEPTSVRSGVAGGLWLKRRLEACGSHGLAEHAESRVRSCQDVGDERPLADRGPRPPRPHEVEPHAAWLVRQSRRAPRFRNDRLLRSRLAAGRRRRGPLARRRGLHRGWRRRRVPRGRGRLLRRRGRALAASPRPTGRATRARGCRRRGVGGGRGRRTIRASRCRPGARPVRAAAASVAARRRRAGTASRPATRRPR